LWDILQDCKKDKDRAMVLTTHSMEEADVLCNRIAIVNDGVVKCLGSQTRLKTLYGGGYHLFVNCERSGDSRADSENMKAVEKKVINLLPKAKKLRQFNG
jgi:ABC-type multidrug transport system ATPase subunit